MRGWVAITDSGWYQQLVQRAQLDEVNFWRPSARPFARLARGTPFFFKLKKPHDAVCGFGYFVTFSVLPEWLATEGCTTNTMLADKPSGPLRVAIYIRFSELELQSGTSAADQEHECRKYAERHGWVVVGVYADEGVRAGNMRGRLSYQRLREDARGSCSTRC